MNRFCALIYLLMAIGVYLNSSSAQAQSSKPYGLGGGVETVQDQRPNAQPITIAEANATFREFHDAALNNDVEYLLSILAEPERSIALAQIKEDGLAEYINKGKHIRTWERHCTTCWDEAGQKICGLYDRRFFKSNRHYSRLYIFNKINDATYITERHSPYKGRGKDLKKNLNELKGICVRLALSTGR